MIDESKLNKFALKVAKDLMRARPSIPLATAIGVANYKMASICSQLRVQLDTKSGYGSTPANIYQLLLLNSGGGKGASLGLADNFYFKDAYAYIDKEVYPKFKQKALDKLEKENNDRPIHNWVKSIGSTTESGLLALSESYSLTGIGGINLEIDEIGNAVTSKADVFELLLQPYDNGLYVPTAKRTDPNAMSVSGMSTNLYCFGNKVRLFEGDSVESAFIRLLDEGYGRRMIFIDDDTEPNRSTPQDIVNEMEASESIIKERESDRAYIKSLVSADNLNKVITLNKEAIYEWAKIKSDGDNYILDHKGLEPAVRSDMSERVFKVAKLASIYAFFQGSEVVTKDNMSEALEVMNESSIVLRGLRKLKPLHQRLLESMLLEGNPVTSQHLLSYSFIPKSYTKKVLEYVDLAKELASELGYVWKESLSKGVTYYQVSKPSKKEVEVFDKVDKKEAKELSDRQKELALML